MVEPQIQNASKCFITANITKTNLIGCTKEN